MIEPDEIPQSLRDLIAAEKARPDPAPEVGERVYARLAAGLGLPPLLGPGSPTAPGPATAPAPGVPGVAGAVAKTAAHTTARGLLTFIVGAAVGATTYGTVQHLRHGPELPAAPTVSIPAPPPVEVAPPAPPAPPPVAAEPEMVKPAAAARQVPGTASGPAGNRDRGLAAERKLVEMARSALARGQVDGALAALYRHARAFRKGELAEERDSLFVQALVAKGDYDGARERATYFHRQYPQSLFSPVVDQAIRSAP